ncbi:MAG: hypothetical protein ACRCZF_14220, partial [Gemmataceae bacterium]
PTAGWDATPLQFGIDRQRMEFSGGTANWAPRSVSVDGNVYYAHEVNYFFWGYMNAEANKKGASITETGMIEWVAAYRGSTGPVYANLPGAVHDGSLYGRAAWAQAGWNYSMTRTFNPPTVVSLPNATPSNAAYSGYLGSGTFSVRIQGFEVPVN